MKSHIGKVGEQIIETAKQGGLIRFDFDGTPFSHAVYVSRVRAAKRLRDTGYLKINDKVKGKKITLTKKGRNWIDGQGRRIANHGKAFAGSRREYELIEENENSLPAEICERFGLRSIEFGNYMRQPERERFLTGIRDGFELMAEKFGIREQDIGTVFGFLEGGKRLSIAIGARGRSKTAAHFEMLPVINLTRKQGPGSLAHEFGHVVDYVRRTKRKNIFWSHCQEWREAYAETDFYKEAFKLNGGRNKGYWTRPEELFARTFEKLVFDTCRKHWMLQNHVAKDNPRYPHAEESVKLTKIVERVFRGNRAK